MGKNTKGVFPTTQNGEHGEHMMPTITMSLFEDSPIQNGTHIALVNMRERMMLQRVIIMKKLFLSIAIERSMS